MIRFNQGQIYTNENCIGCNKCVSSCPVLGANVSVFHRNYNAGLKEGYYTIQVNAKKCCNCGECLTACNHNARSYNDDTAEFIFSLGSEQNYSGERYSLIVDSALFAAYDDILPQVFGFLKSKGVEKIYSTSLGQEIAIWQNVNYVKNHKDDALAKRAYLANNCSAFLNYVELFHPYLVHNIIPVQSDFMCTAVYVKKYLGDKNKLVYLSPCTAAKDELTFHDKEKLVSHSIRYSKLFSLIKNNLSGDVVGNVDIDSLGLNKIIPVGEASSVSYSYFFSPAEGVKHYETLDKSVFTELHAINHSAAESLRPAIATFSSCAKGCCYGPGIDADNIDYRIELHLKEQLNNSFKNYTNQHSYDENLSRMNELFSNLSLNSEDFEMKIVKRYHQSHQVPEYAFNAVYEAMKKTSERKRHIDCGSCGYPTCRDMAQAIAYGYNKKENCIHYMNEEMESRYSIDPQTGILNRNAFVAKATSLLVDNPDKRYFICSGDINKFKIINELYGSAAGDEVLKFIASKLSDVVGEQGVCGRFNGGNFILCLEAGPENMGRLRQIKQFDIETIDFPVTMRFGIYITQSEHENLQEIMNWAAMARDENKENVTFQNEFVLFTDELKKRIDDEGKITSEMKTALEDQEFQIVFQPQYETATGNLVGAEVLCRWYKKNGDTVMPGLFIPIAEKNGFIKRLDTYIWNKAFSAMRGWLDKNYDVVPISVNISRLTMFDERFVYEIKHLFDQYKIPKDLIHFELTESAIMKDGDKLLERLEQLKKLDVKIAMDDFGSGYSSLTTLKDMPIDILKLDMGFLRSDDNTFEIGEKGGNIISSIVHMAQNIDVVTIAEGVEHESQVLYLKGLGCDIIQGYIYARPMSEADFVKVLSEKAKSFPVDEKRKQEVTLSGLYDPNSEQSKFFEHYAGPAAIFIYDESLDKLELERCNEKALNLFGFSSLPNSSVRGILDKYLQKNTKNELLNGIKKAIDTKEEVITTTKNIKYLTETPLWIRESIWEIGQKGNIHTMYILLTDITNEKLSENTIKSFVHDGYNGAKCNVYFKFDPKNLKESMQLRFLKVNKQFEDISGFPANEVLGWTEKEAMKMIHPLDLPGFMKTAIKAIYHHCEVPFVYEYRAVKKDGSYAKVKIVFAGERQEDKSYLIAANFMLV